MTCISAQVHKNAIVLSSLFPSQDPDRKINLQKMNMSGGMCDARPVMKQVRSVGDLSCVICPFLRSCNTCAVFFVLFFVLLQLHVLSRLSVLCLAYYGCRCTMCCYFVSVFVPVVRLKRCSYAVPMLSLCCH